MSLTKEELVRYYHKLYKIRETELRIVKEYPNQEMRCPVHLSIGQEAPSAAVNIFLKKNDFAISYHRAHAHYIAKGGSLKKMIAEIYGKESGCSSGAGGSMHLIDLKKNFLGSTAIVSSSIPVGVGFAYSLKYYNNNSRICIYIGDASCEEGVFFESLNFAILKKLPILFICENNKYSVYSNLEQRQPKNRKLYKLAKSFGIESFYLNSKDPIKFCSNLKKIMKIKKPLFIEIDTYRYYEHCGPNKDDNLNYRPKKEVEFWNKRDPVNLTEKYLLKKRFLKKEDLIKIKKKILKEISNAFIFAKKSKKPNYEKYFKLKNY
jgi:TPP-dependent pyruvate/acetoin dehydrogenase alpha subunit